MEPEKKPFKCKFCGSGFSQERALIHHKKTAVKCLSLRETEIVVLFCGYCDSEFTSKAGFSRHQENCKAKKVSEKHKKKIEELKEEVKSLREELGRTKISTYRSKKLANIKDIRKSVIEKVKEFGEVDFEKGIKSVCVSLERIRKSEKGCLWTYGKGTSNDIVLFQYMENGTKICDDGSPKFRGIYSDILFLVREFCGKKIKEICPNSAQDPLSTKVWADLSFDTHNLDSDDAFSNFTKCLKRQHKE